MISVPDRLSPLTCLRMRWAMVALCCGLFLAGGYGLLATDWRPEYAARWLIQSSAVTVYLLGALWRSLEYNIRPGETELLADFGAGNILTMIRGVLIAGLSGFLFQPWPSGWLAWAPGVLFTAACLSDHLDGYLARATNHATRMGEILDMSFDGLGILVAAVLAVQYGRVPVWYLLVAAARYLFLLGIWLRRRRGLPVVNLPPSIRRRAFAGIQMGFLFFILLPFFSPSHTHIAAFVFAAPFLIGFLVDWLTVSGHRLGESSIPLSNRWKWTNTALNWLPAGLRSIAALLITGQITIWFQTGISYAPVAAYFIGLAQVLVLVFLLLGASGRISAIAGLVLLGLQQMSANLTPTQIALIMLYTAILYLGTGPLSLWKPEDRWIYRRAGERPE